MPEGPLGFSRFTSLGPFVEEDDILQDFVVTRLEGAGAEEIEVERLSEEVVFDFYMDMKKPGSYKSSISITSDGVRSYTLRYSRIRTSNKDEAEVRGKFESAIEECGMPEGAKVRYADLTVKLAPHVEQSGRDGARTDLDSLVEFIECSSKKVKRDFPEARTRA